MLRYGGRKLKYGAVVGLAVLASMLTPAFAETVYAAAPVVGPPAIITAGKLTMAINASSPPMMYIDDAGAIIGYRAEIGREIAKRLGLEPEFVNVPFQPQIPGLNSGRWDVSVSGAFITPERSQVVEMIATESQGVSLVVRVDRDQEIHNTDDMAGMVVGAEQGGYEWRAMEAISAELVGRGLAPLDLRGFEKAAIAYQALNVKQIDAVAGNDPIAFYYQQHSDGVFRQALKSLAPAPQSIAVKGGNDDLAQAVSRVLTEMSADGWYDTLVAEWGFGGPEDRTFPIVYTPAK
ncbi:MAG TPA: transporter substrate-binding domain-containing protein [Devosia sp.]|nr:transporter substrate-binding domain-containing protein [Devosia sp.]